MASTDRLSMLKDQFERQRGIWSPAWEAVAVLNPAYLEGYLKIQQAAQGRSRLSSKIQELCHVAVASSVTHIHLPAVKAHIQAALAAGAAVEEIFEVLGLSYLLGVHTVTLGFPILQELMEELGTSAANPSDASEKESKAQIKDNFIAMRGFWPETFTPLLELDPEFFDNYAEFSSFSSKSKVLEPKYRELIICAIDAATTHLYGRGTKIHMRNALKLGATPTEIIEMLEITSLMGIHGVSSSAPLLLELAGQK